MVTGAGERQDAHGKLIVFEGLDGAGTSTQVNHLRHWLVEAGYPIETTREPSNGPLGAAIRQAIEGRTSMDPMTLALAFAADRCDHTYNDFNGIASSLADGRWVLCDRYVLSSLAYQRTPRVQASWLRELNKWCIVPDLTVFIDTDPEVCIQRIDMRSSHFELFHQAAELARVRQNYEDALREGHFIGHLLVVDGGRKESDVFADLLRGVQEWMAAYGIRQDAVRHSSP